MSCLHIVEFETWKSVKAVYFKMCLGKGGQRCEIFGKTEDIYCSIVCYLSHYFFLNHLKLAIYVHSMCICIWGFYLFKWRTLKKKSKNHVKVYNKKSWVCTVCKFENTSRNVIMYNRRWSILYVWQIMTFYLPYRRKQIDR